MTVQSPPHLVLESTAQAPPTLALEMPAKAPPLLSLHATPAAPPARELQPARLPSGWLGAVASPSLDLGLDSVVLGGCPPRNSGTIGASFPALQMEGATGLPVVAAETPLPLRLLPSQLSLGVEFLPLCPLAGWGFPMVHPEASSSSQ
ncbi:UNVERIFIED_CONTAM: hypothetical protein FKN15_018045 [Acipenser sinensis]